jgi:hypothetical protein
MTKLNTSDALQLSEQFRDASSALSSYLYGNWSSFNTAAQLVDRNKLQSMVQTLMGVATDLVTHAVGAVLDDAQTSIADIGQATTDATKAAQNIADIKKAIVITTSLILLATAIPTGNAAAIFAAVKGVAAAVG